MIIYLLRHGRTAMDNLKRSDGWLDLPLSDKGRMGLIEAQQYLKLQKLGAIYAPPLRRTEETAHIVQSGMMQEPNVVPSPKALTWNLGVLAGVKKDIAHPEVKQHRKNGNSKPLGGESYNEFRRRFMGWFKTRVEQAKKNGKPILIICSGSCLRLIGSELFGDDEAFNLDEGGLVELHTVGNSWHKEIIFGDEDGSERVS